MSESRTVVCLRGCCVHIGSRDVGEESSLIALCVAAAESMADRNVQEWISDQLYTLLGERGPSQFLHLECTQALVGTVSASPKQGLQLLHETPVITVHHNSTKRNFTCVLVCRVLC